MTGVGHGIRREQRVLTDAVPGFTIRSLPTEFFPAASIPSTAHYHIFNEPSVASGSNPAYKPLAAIFARLYTTRQLTRFSQSEKSVRYPQATGDMRSFPLPLLHS